MTVTRFRLELAYRGAAYAGWQRQSNARAVQQVVEEALADLAGALVPIVGASRTDAGVHAHGQVAHVEIERPLPPAALVFGLNHRLPEDIRVLAAETAPEGFHARRCAAAKEYRYRLVRSPVLDPFVAPFAILAPRRLDRAALDAATRSLSGTHDFAAFALAGGAHTHSVRTVFLAEWLESGSELTLRIVGDGFLRGMVRSLVGTLLEVSVGRRSPTEFAALLAGGVGRGAAGPTAPAHALTLERVFYPVEWGGPELPAAES